MGRRNSHHRTPFTATERKLKKIAAARRGSDAFRIALHACCQSIVRANITRKTRMAAVRIHRIPFLMAGLIQAGSVAKS
jgi:hypothetical protein